MVCGGVDLFPVDPFVLLSRQQMDDLIVGQWNHGCC